MFCGWLHPLIIIRYTSFPHIWANPRISPLLRLQPFVFFLMYLPSLFNIYLYVRGLPQILNFLEAKSISPTPWIIHKWEFRPKTSLADTSIMLRIVHCLRCVWHWYNKLSIFTYLKRMYQLDIACSINNNTDDKNEINKA